MNTDGEHLSGHDALKFLAHMGDATLRIDNDETVEKINEIQKECGVHETCENGEIIRFLFKHHERFDDRT